MAQPQFQRLNVISIKDHPQLNEKWVQDRIAADPAILGLGDLILKDRERSQPRAGALDILLQDPDSTRRYEVEIQLGKTDESHIIRTIEYWDIEKKRYPNYDHTAVIVAEDITSRFLNVIVLLNGTIPLVAIQMKAVTFGDAVSLFFTKVVDAVQLGLAEEDEEVHDAADRAFWEAQATKGTVAMADEMLRLVKTLDPHLELNYTKFYIGLARNGIADNFIKLRPQKAVLRFEPRLERSDDTERKLESAGLDMMDYDAKWGRYRIRLSKGDITKAETTILELLTEAFRYSREFEG